MADRIRAFDWSSTSLGPIDHWPGNLRTTLGILLNSNFPMFLFWGEDLICFYNDAFRPSLGADGKHPMVGKKGRDGWADIWHIIGKLLDDVRTTGKAIQYDDLLVPFFRNGRTEDSYWTFSYSPIFGDQEGIDGIFVTCVETTEKVRTIHDLAESESRFRTMAEGSDILIAMADEHSNATYFNKAWIELSGRPVGTLLQLGWADLIHPEDRGAFIQTYLDSLERQAPFNGQFRVKNQKGEYSWLFTKGAVRTRPDGSFAGHISSSVDITEQIRILDQVRDSELDLRNIVLKAPIGICILDAATLVAETVNSSFLEVAGRPLDAIAGKYYWDAFAEAKPYYEDALAGVARDGKTFFADEVELMLIRHGVPERVYITFVYAPVFDLAGHVKKVAIWVQENTTQVASRRRLQEAEKKATLAINSADLGVYEIDYASDSMLTDQRFKTIWGVDDPSFTRSDYVRSIHPDDLHDRELAHQRSLRTGQLDYSARIFWPDGSARWLRITGTVIYDEHAKPIKLIGIAQDITDAVLARRKIEEVVAERTRELAEANEQLQRSNAELSQFAYIASHDLQEPIRKIATFASLLEDQPETLPAARNYLAKIISAANRMQTLIRGVLSYSVLSRTPRAFEPVDLNQILRDVLAEFDLLIEQKQAQIRYRPLPTIDAVPHQMTQLFTNLISNALKYTSDGSPPVVSIACRLEDGQYHIDITDNGIGFAQEHAEQIFSIFKRLHRKTEYSGTGIGLAMCKKIVENHHGQISAQSQPGQGATIHLVLPARGQYREL